MKNKILPSRYLVYLIGLSLFLFLSSNVLFSQSSLDWVEMGPSNFSGETKALIFDNQDPTYQSIYAASTTGGIYLSYNLGQTWYKLDGADKAYKVSTMVQQTDGTIFMGTGSFDGIAIGTGIYKSTDGTNFTLLASTAPNYVSEDWWYINKLAIDEVNNRIYAATNTGIKYSSDGGNTWATAKTGDTLELMGNSYDIEIGSNGLLLADHAGKGYISPSGNPDQFMVLDTLPDYAERLEFAIAPTDPDMLYVTIATPEGALNSVWHSKDGGTEWYVIAPGGSQSLNFFGVGNNISEGCGITSNVLTVFPNNPERVLLGGYNMWEGTKYDEDGFFQWVMKSEDQPLFFSYVQPFHFSYTFRPNNEKQLLIGSSGGVFIGLNNSNNFTFESKNRNFYSTQFSTIGVTGRKYRAIGGTTSNGTILLDGSLNPITARYGYPVWFSANGLPVFDQGGYCENPIIDQFSVLYSRVGSDFRRSEEFGNFWSGSFFSTEVTNTLPATNDYIAPAVLWENFEDEESRDSAKYVAFDFLVTGDPILVTSNNRAYPFEATAPFAMNPGDTAMIKDIVSTKYFVGAEDAVWMTKEILFFGKVPEWFKIADKSNTGFDGFSNCMALSSDANYLWVGTKEGKLYRLSNIRKAYDYDRADVRSPFCIISTTEVPIYWTGTQTPVDVEITSIAIDPQNPEHVLLTLNGYGYPQNIMRSTNGLDQLPVFESIQGAVPDIPAFSSLIEMNDPNLAMVGTMDGIYMTEDFTAPNPTWYKPADNNGFAIGSTPVTMLKQQLVKKKDVIFYVWDGTEWKEEIRPGNDNFGVVYAATYGRGLFYCDQFQKPVGVSEPITFNMPDENIHIYPNPVINNATIEYKISEKTSSELYIFDLNGRLLMNEKITEQTPGVIKHTMDFSGLDNGTYFIQVIHGSNKSQAKFVVIK